MDDKKSNGIGLPSILTIIFVIAKLLGIINWSWWLVFAPIWVSTLLGLLILAIVAIVEATVD